MSLCTRALWIHGMVHLDEAEKEQELELELEQAYHLLIQQHQPYHNNPTTFSDWYTNGFKDDSENDENNSTTLSDSEDDEDVQNHPTTLSESKHAGDEADIEQEYDLTKLVAGTAIDEPNYKLIGDDEDRHDKEFKIKEPAQHEKERGMSVTWILHI